MLCVCIYIYKYTHIYTHIQHKICILFRQFFIVDMDYGRKIHTLLKQTLLPRYLGKSIHKKLFGSLLLTTQCLTLSRVTRRLHRLVLLCMCVCVCPLTVDVHRTSVVIGRLVYKTEFHYEKCT